MKFRILLTCAFLCSGSSAAYAAAFYIQEQSVSGLGTAFAGAVADTPDASTVYYNPAGMTRLDPRPQISVNANLLLPSADTDNGGSTVNSGATTGNTFVTLQGDDGGDPFTPALVPNLYFAAPLTNQADVWIGIGISAPFGLKNEYGGNFFGRYNSTSSKLQTIDVAPSLAWAVNDWFSIGGGIDVQYVDAELKNAIPSPATVGGPTAMTDGETNLSGDDLTVGFNFGVQIQPQETTKIGAHFRQGISHTLEGRIINRVPFDVPATGGSHIRVSGAAELDLPNIASVGISQKVSEDLTLLGSVNWYEWSNFDDIPVVTPVGASSTEQGYKNTFGFAMGARYALNEEWVLKAGFQYDQTPTVDAHRSTRIPDGDRMWYSAGATWNLDKDWTLDFAGTYVDVDKEQINIQETNSITNVVTRTVGTTEGSVGILAASFNFKF